MTNTNIQLAIGCQNSFIVQISGVSPVDLVSDFDTNDFNITACFSWIGETKTIAVDVISSTELMLTVDQDVIGKADYVPTETYSRTSNPPSPALIYGVSKSNGKRYCLGQFSITFTPGK